MEDPSLEEMVEIKQAVALKEKIGEKAKIISEKLGKIHNSFYICGGGGLAGDGIDFSEYGKIYEKDKFRIKNVIDQDNYQKIEISLVTRITRPFLYFFKTTEESSEIVYMQKTGKDSSGIIIFRKENEWLADFNKLYDQVLTTNKMLTEFNIKRRERLQTQEIAQNFGLESYLPK